MCVQLAKPVWDFYQNFLTMIQEGSEWTYEQHWFVFSGANLISRSERRNDIRTGSGSVNKDQLEMQKIKDILELRYCYEHLVKILTRLQQL